MMTAKGQTTTMPFDKDATDTADIPDTLRARPPRATMVPESE